jgi:hypothetical protein
MGVYVLVIYGNLLRNLQLTMLHFTQLLALDASAPAVQKTSQKEEQKQGNQS